MAQKLPDDLSRLITLIIKHRGAVVMIVFAVMVWIEIIEQLLMAVFGQAVHVYYDIFIFFVIVPLGVYLLLKVLTAMEVARERALMSSDLHNELSQKLGDARTWDELVTQITAYPHRVVPRAHVTLFTVNPTDQSLRPEAACDSSGVITLAPEETPHPDSLPVGSLPQLLSQPEGVIAPARAAQADSLTRYDLPIIYNGVAIGVLKLEFSPGDAPTADQARALKVAAPVMGLALEGALLQQLAEEQAAASQAQRQEIAQTLHDTLAQNVGYLRLKLDQLTGANAIREIGVILQELERMRATADEAYQQVRHTLDELNPSQADNLVSTLFKQARAISLRSGFTLRTSQMGKQNNLPGPVREQILYIAREALYNVEKHAKANIVHLQFIWLECELILKITDDGVGFDPRQVPTEGHYGLWIMQQRAQEIGATLKIGPATDGSGGAPGTEVTLWVPCPSAKMPAAVLTGAVPAQYNQPTEPLSKPPK